MSKNTKQDNIKIFEAWVATIDERICDWFQTLSPNELERFDYSIESLDDVERYLIENYSLDDFKDVSNRRSIDAIASYMLKVFSQHWKYYKFKIELEDERNILYNRPSIITDPEIGMAFSPYFLLPRILNLKRVGDLQHLLKTKWKQYVEKYGEGE